MNVTQEPARRARNPLARFRHAVRLIGCLAMLLAAPVATAQTDRIYLPAVEDVLGPLVAHINAETVRIDMSAWYLTEHAVSIALVNAFDRGVQIRLIGDRGAIFEIDPLTKYQFYWLASRGIPIRLRRHPTWFPEIAHWKATVFKGQQLAAFGSANYTPVQLRPAAPGNYSDETVLFTTDPAVVGAFLTRFDLLWNDTAWEPESRNPGPPYFANWNDACAVESACGDYRQLYPNPAPMLIDTARLEPDRPTPPDLIWGQGPSFNGRLVQEILREPNAVRLVAYRLTVDDVTEALLATHRAGVPTRVIVEPSEYANRKWPEFWLTHANIDKLWAAGVPIRQRQHAGLTHMKMLVTSRYATNASSNFAAAWQRDHNYFVSAAQKPAAYQAMAARFDAMWNDAAGFTAFVPGPPDAPGLSSPAAGATGVSQAPTLRWNAAPFATAYEVYLGTSPAGLSLVATVPALLVNDPPSTYSWMPPGTLAAATTFYWKVVARTNATVRDPSLVASSGTRSFITGGTLPDGTPAADFTGDQRANLAVFRCSTGEWYVLGLPAPLLLGGCGDIPVPGDYDGDGRVDPAMYNRAIGSWSILESGSNYALRTLIWGLDSLGDVPVPGDYDGDGRNDPAVYRPGTGMWHILRSSTGYASTMAMQWGLQSMRDMPVPGDYDGDGTTDPAVYRPGTGMWHVMMSGSRYTSFLAKQWGIEALGDVPVQADYDGDGRADPAVYRPATGTWHVMKSSSNYRQFLAEPWGLQAHRDVPVPADYDGDGKADPAVYRPASGHWYVLQSSSNYQTFSGAIWGTAALGDIPATGTAHPAR